MLMARRGLPCTMGPSPTAWRASSAVRCVCCTEVATPLHKTHQRSPGPAGCLNLRITRPVPEMRDSAEVAPAAASAGSPSELVGAPNPPKGGEDAAAPNKLVAAGAAPNIAVPAPPKSGPDEAAVAPNAGAVAGPLEPNMKVGVAVLEPPAPKGKLAAGRSAG